MQVVREELRVESCAVLYSIGLSIVESCRASITCYQCTVKKGKYLDVTERERAALTYSTPEALLELIKAGASLELIEAKAIPETNHEYLHKKNKALSEKGCGLTRAPTWLVFCYIPAIEVTVKLVA
jgi:hypothetical protein